MKLVEKGEVKIVGFRVVCPGEEFSARIPKAVNELSKRRNEISNVVDMNTQLGAFVVDVTQNGEDGYWEWLEVEEFNRIPEGDDVTFGTVGKICGERVRGKRVTDHESL
ncbi:hypothetical protein JSY36_19160 [Bacillus sp. H-16]|uniref:hypothetical protein n=1 Tax=Alteribacter salitolerans TaxID=2912333 RepID=UPI001962D905|nr:hypothetical protein [Alteribacter salitolerans]MBM7097860.1 hypothetical protein [Alteribacter salitolerans]